MSVFHPRPRARQVVGSPPEEPAGEFLPYSKLFFNMLDLSNVMADAADMHDVALSILDREIRTPQPANPAILRPLYALLEGHPLTVSNTLQIFCSHVPIFRDNQLKPADHIVAP